MAWDDGLEGPAYDIAASKARRLRVRAGPGTGKTFALMRRIARLLEEGVSPARILVSTFTRVAAEDLKRELNELDAPRVAAVRATTIHSLCFSMLKRADVLAATGRTARPLLDYETRFLLEDVGPAFGKLGERRKLLKAYEAAWARRQTDLPGFPDEARDGAFQAALLDWLRFHDAMLIGELVPEALRYLEHNPLAAERFRFRHVVVDEYQDLNVAEQSVIDVLAEDAELTIVGDENQSIYSFKHAHPEGLRDFGSRHPQAEDAGLATCWRCPHQVLSMANSLIGHNEVRSDRELLPYRKARKAWVRVVQWQTVPQEAAGLAEVVRASIAAGEVEAGKVLVLAPNRVFANPVRDALQEAGVPAESLFREKELDGSRGENGNPRAEEALTLLTLAADPEDVVALRCWCGLSAATSFGCAAWQRVREHCDSTGSSVVDVLAGVREGEVTWPQSWRLRDRLQQLHARLGALKGVSGRALVDAVFPSGDADFEALRTTAEDVLRSLSVEEGEAVCAERLAEQVRTRVGRPEVPTDVDYVRVMSLHKSKGLTADMVVVAGFVAGVMPRIDRDDGDGVSWRDSLEEQRRLLYVGLTRTRKILILSSVVRLRGEDAHRLQMPGGRPGRVRSVGTSQFLRELGQAAPTPITGEVLLREWPGCRSKGAA
ncbi:MAG: ATP-dependent helicase [Acidobacteria bacterium]|nr:ATP-dependent helicase [Acidobacteriota bacterium]